MPATDSPDLPREIDESIGPSKNDLPPTPSSAAQNATFSNYADPKSERGLAARRRSERVTIEIPVHVCVCEEDKEPVFFHAKTVDVSVHGALLDVALPVDIGQTLRVVNARTKRETECHVLRFAKRYEEGGGQIVVEFAGGVSPHFWGIASPPADWDAVSPSPVDLPKTEKPTREPLQAPAIVREAQAKSRVPKGLAIGLIVSAVLLLGWIALRGLSGSGSAAGGNAPAGVEPEDAMRIPRISRTRLATVEDFDSDAVSWLRDMRQQVSGKIPGFYYGSKKSNAYILVGTANERRVVILAESELRYNAEYPSVAVAACVPREAVHKIKWADPSVPESDGDGLLIVRAAAAPASGVVLFLRSSQVVAASPADYRDIEFGDGCQP